MKEILNAILQGIIQGVTEFLPISSSGHLAIYQHLVHTSGESNLMFTTLLHVGTLVAVCLVYRQTIGKLILEMLDMLRDLFTGRFFRKPLSVERKTVLMMILSTALLVLGILPIFNGYAAKDLCDLVAANENYFWIVGVALIGTAVLMFLAWRITTSDRPTRRCATTKDAVLIGFAQLVAAVFPGLSRSGSTTATALACGLDKKYATQYSFILSIPAVAAATLLELKDAVEIGSAASLNWGAALIGILTSAVVGVAAIKTFLWLIKKNRYIIFSFYCAAMGILVLIWSAVEQLAK